MKYLELTTKLFEIYIIVMLTVCAILLGVLVYNTGRANSNYNGLVNELSRLELIDYGEE